MTALEHVRRALASYDEGGRDVRRELSAALALLEGAALAADGDDTPTSPGTPASKSQEMRAVSARGAAARVLAELEKGRPKP